MILRLIGDHGPLTAGKRLLHLVRRAGLRQTMIILASALDDKYLKGFDRRYRIKTSGFIRLQNTSFEPTRLRDATQYGPVNGWALRRLLLDLNLPRHLRFVDFGCGLGRACILAAEYGFERVTGVELAPELCVGARENVTQCRPPAGKLSPITILQMDVLDYCEGTEDDVVFMFRPFSCEFFQIVLDKLVARAGSRRQPIMVIYSERMMVPGSFAPILAADLAFRKVHEAGIWGQAFYVFECGSEFRPMEMESSIRAATLSGTTGE